MNARRAAWEALLAWENQRRNADEVLRPWLGKLPDTRDAALASELFHGVLRNRMALDFLIARLRDKPLDAGTRQLVRLGLYQIRHTRVATHAAVNETVAIAPAKSRGLVNALLRRMLREVGEMEAALTGAPLAVRYSHPDFLVDRWLQRYGNEEVERLCEWNNTPAQNFGRINTLKISVEQFLADFPACIPVPGNPGVVALESLPMPALEGGLLYVQDPSTLLASVALAVEPGMKVLDACAAPGGKTAHLAALMNNEGHIDAVERDAQRLDMLQGNLERLGATCAAVHRHDWQKGAPPADAGSYDRILVDSPCSNTGVLRRRVDARWRLAPGEFERMPRTQLEILSAVAPLLKPGGKLVYSTCSIEPEENGELVKRFLSAHAGWERERTVESLPFRDGMDGAFVAVLVRA